LPKNNPEPIEIVKLQIGKSLDNPDYYINRELSWVRFNARVLEEAHDLWHPLLERVKFLAICGSNLDEFFMTRIPRLMKQINKGSVEKSMDGMTPIEQIEASRKETLPIIEAQTYCWTNELVPALEKENIHIRKVADLTENDRINLRVYFQSAILPALKVTRGVSSSEIENLHVNLYINGFSDPEACSVIDVPVEQFGRLINITSSHQPLLDKVIVTDSYNYVFLEDLIAANLDLVFPGEPALAAYPFRLTRNGEIDILMDESADFLSAVKKSLSNRKAGFPSRIEFDKKTPAEVRSALASSLGLPDRLQYEVDGPLGLVDFWQLLKINCPELKDKTFQPSTFPLQTVEQSIFATIAKRDVVLYHPYDSFEVVVDLLKEAATDTDVQKICITMYRMDHKSPIVDALIEAAGKGKNVTVIIELKAKFDEENNILLAAKLKEAGVNIVYNFPNFKVHAKLCLIERREKAGVTRYSHLGSGNYNAATAKVYGDIGYLTANPEVGAELEELFNILINGLQEKEFKHLLVAPKTLKPEILSRIDREIAFHRRTGNGYIAIKLNNLEEKEVIQALYRASMAGIKIDLNVRGLCCLKPGIPGVSDNISVISIVGRFLEHARIFYFQAGEESEVLIGSSDLMFRNLNERVEVLFSVPDPQLRRAILEHMLKIHLEDNVKARKLLVDGSYQRVTPKEGEEIVNSQVWLIQNRGIWHEYAPYIPNV
jgi:polyphosphate kinase 1